jgi:hypothetical protein
MFEARAGTVNGRIVELLSRRPLRAYFVAEIAESFRRAGTPIGELDESLASLEETGTVLIRMQACADPHLDDADLRIVAFIDACEDGQDAQSAAGELIDRTWQRWLGDYLANHRCM